jgi:hypothetical protein
MHDPTAPSSDRGLTNLHRETLTTTTGILNDSEAVSVPSSLLKAWEGRLARIAGFIDKGESHKGVAAATEVRLEIRAARGVGS